MWHSGVVEDSLPVESIELTAPTALKLHVPPHARLLHCQHAKLWQRRTYLDEKWSCMNLFRLSALEVVTCLQCCRVYFCKITGSRFMEPWPVCAIKSQHGL